MTAINGVRRYIVMDTDALAQSGAAMLTNGTFDIAGAAINLPALSGGPTATMRVIDSIKHGGPKLVEMLPEGELSLRLAVPGIKIVPEVYYDLQRIQFDVATPPDIGLQPQATIASRNVAMAIKVTDKDTGQGIKDARVVAFTNFAARIGYDAVTDAHGVATVSGLDTARKIERAYIYPANGYWSGYFADIAGGMLANITLERINVRAASLFLTQLYGHLPADAGKATKIAIIDSGISNDHPDLQNVEGGLNCVNAEIRADPAAADDWKPAKVMGGEHGTHVAGIASGGNKSSGFRGVAPGALLRSYRVFPHHGGKASNYDIINAIRSAVADGCDIINMSLGGGGRDDATAIEIERALEAGVVVIVAAGNDGRKPVAMPAALPGCVAVSAMGREKSFPDTSNGMSTILAPKGVPTATDFMADFSNIGPEIDVVGPGVEIVSTLPGQNYGAMNGTSMAAPAIAGFAAYLLSEDPVLRNMRGLARSRELKKRLYSYCRPRGFGRNYEGFGLPLPPAAIV